ncbi:MAG TPA: phage tail protein [Geobacteraceae bacterium]|nr:phage tail protein [Geobacteraceae bacterium]
MALGFGIDAKLNIDVLVGMGKNLVSTALGLNGDPYLNFNFLVEIEGLLVGGFTDVTGLQAEIETHEYREGGLNDYIHRLAGPVRYPSSLALKHGLTDSTVLWEWHRDVRSGIIERRNVTIILCDTTGLPSASWTLEKAYPVKWSGPDLKADSNTVAVESVELVHCGFAPA